MSCDFLVDNQSVSTQFRWLNVYVKRSKSISLATAKRHLLRSRFIFSVIFTLLAFSVLAQKGYKWELGLHAGPSNYLGEIGGREQSARPFIFDMKMQKTRWDVGPYLRFRFKPQFSARLAMHYLRISGDDKLSQNPARKYRNLNFRNDIYDLEGTLHWHFYNSDKPMGIYMRTNVYFTAYLFGGIGAYMHNPKAFYQGDWIALQPLRTEGVQYSKAGYCLPFGAGFYVTLVKRRRAHRIGLEVNWRYTNTDYLDDISTVYKDPAELNSHTAAALSNRNPEVIKQPEGFSQNYGWHGVDKNGKPVNMAPRGNPDNKDSYLSINVTYGISIKNRVSRAGKRKIRSVIF